MKIQKVTLCLERLLIYILVLIAIFQIDAFLVRKNIINIPAFVFSSVSFLIIIFVCFRSKHRKYQLLFIDYEYVYLVFLLLLVYLFQIPGLFSLSGTRIDLKIFIYWGYSLLLFISGLFYGEYIGKNASKISAILLFVLCGLLLLDYSIWPFFSPDSSRASATLVNPNIAAFVVVLLFIISLSHPEKGITRRDTVLIVLASLGIAITWSIGGIITFIFIVCILLLLWLTSFKKLGDFLLFTLIILAIILASGYLFSTKLGLDILDFKPNDLFGFRNIVARGNAAEIAIELVKNKPIFGHGISYIYTLDIGPHNMFLRLLVEGGVFGLVGALLAFAGLLWFLARRRTTKLYIYFFALFLMSFSTHNLLEARSIIFLTGIMVASTKNDC